VSVLTPQQPPSKLRIDFDYGLALKTVVPALDLNNPENTFELPLQLTNKAAGARFNINLKSMNVELKIGLFVRILRERLYHVIYGTVLEKRTTGSLEYSIIYGHPDYGRSRRTTKTIELHIFKSDDGKRANLKDNKGRGRYQPDLIVSGHQRHESKGTWSDWRRTGPPTKRVMVHSLLGLAGVYSHHDQVSGTGYNASWHYLGTEPVRPS
jgi:hypothetical protein